MKVNGQPAKVTSTDGGAPYRFEAVVDLDAGANTVVVEARDGNNNVATKTYSVPTTGTAKTYEYDGNGNLRFEKLPNGTVVREYRWDQQNRLVRVLEGTHESVYEYDGESRRVRIKELENSSETKNETFVWCGSRICQKRSGTTVVRNYFREGLEEGSGPTDYFYTRDHLGSVREVVGSDGTTIASRVSYDPWGKVTESGSGALTDFGFTGHHLDRPTGLALTWFRGYDPLLGRWLSRDPIGLRGGLNLYGYVNGKPIDVVDVLGLDPAGMGGRGYCVDWDRLTSDYYCKYECITDSWRDRSVQSVASCFLNCDIVATTAKIERRKPGALPQCKPPPDPPSPDPGGLTDPLRSVDPIALCS